jgi:beta-glucanase (GH16 family)
MQLSRSLSSLLLCLLVFASLSAQSQQIDKTSKVSNGGKMQLVWSDEFNYKGLPDPTKWNYDVGGWGWGNNELQYYTKDSLGNASVNNGLLTIVLKQQKMEDRKYSSARLVTKGKGDWIYGRIDVRAKLPKGLGTWPAIWMLGSTTPLKWPDDGEIDIMEHVGFNPGFIHATTHTKSFNHMIGNQKTDTIIVKDFDTQFHDYSVIWNKDSVTILFDNQAYYTFKNNGTGKAAWPFDGPMHLLLNIAFGGNWGGTKGVDDAVLPAKMEIDYVRVYQLK